MSEFEHMIKTQGLSKSFKQVKAVNDLSLEVRKGDVYGFLGPNGAGKTTTIKMVLGLVHPDNGDIWLKGRKKSESGVEIHEGIGYLPERTQFYSNLTALQTLEFFAELKGVGKEECDELLAKVGMDKWRDEKVGTFSKGMVQLVGVAQALLGEPQLLILDEPTSGLDPRWARVLKDIIIERNSRGATVFFSSHLLFEVQELCNRVAILNKGQLAIEDTVDRVSQGFDIKPKLILKIAGNVAQAAEVIKNAGFEEMEIHGNQIKVCIDAGNKSKVLQALAQSGIEIDDFRTEEPSLEDAFMEYVGTDSGAGGVRYED